MTRKSIIIKGIIACICAPIALFSLIGNIDILFSYLFKSGYSSLFGIPINMSTVIAAGSILPIIFLYCCKWTLYSFDLYIRREITLRRIFAIFCTLTGTITCSILVADSHHAATSLLQEGILYSNAIVAPQYIYIPVLMGMISLVLLVSYVTDLIEDKTFSLNWSA